MNTRPLCIYHANCLDGFTAAWVVNKYFEGKVDFHAGKYGEAPPDVKGRTVYIVDFSYPLAVMQGIWENTKVLTILDHHKSAIEELNNTEAMPDAFDMAVFDSTRSGAAIAWDFFFPDVPLPYIIRHVQDRDLWKFELVGTKETCAYMFTLDQTMEAWDSLMRTDPGFIEAIGRVLVKKQAKDVKSLVESGAREFYLDGHKTLALNTVSMLTSDSGNYMMNHYDIPFAVCYWDSDKERHFSLRSLDHKWDVQTIAKKYGGGGHRNAAGFKVPFTHILAINSQGEYQS